MSDRPVTTRDPIAPAAPPSPATVRHRPPATLSESLEPSFRRRLAGPSTVGGAVVIGSIALVGCSADLAPRRDGMTARLFVA
jgi:hypothetical protein